MGGDAEKKRSWSSFSGVHGRGDGLQLLDVFSTKLVDDSRQHLLQLFGLTVATHNIGV